jgi:outer membrane receptor protein involved in Fe transport
MRAVLVEVSTGDTVQRTDVGLDGRFAFHDVPFAHYQIDILLDSMLLATAPVDVLSAVPVHAEITKLREYSAREVVVETFPYRPDRTRSGTSKIYTATAIQNLPAASGTKQMEAVLLNTPGVVPDEDGRMHVRGEDAQLQYVIDGIPVTANMTRVYGSLFDANLIKTVDVQTGGMTAEYGVAAAGILSITTKSGFDAPLFVHASALGGSFGTREAAFEAGGTMGGTIAAFVAGRLGETDRYLDPIALGDPIHDMGRSRSFFGKINGIITPNLDINLLGSYSHTEFEIPNGDVRTPAQDQRQDQEDYMVGARLSAYFGESSALSLLGYRRHAVAGLTSGGLRQITSAADSVKAVQENEKFFIGSERINEATGGQLEFSMRGDWFDYDHMLRVGVGAEEYPLSEFFTFAVTNEALSNPDSAGGDIRYRPYDLTQGGRPFLVDTSATGKRYSAYVQDRIQSGAWTINVGLRYDMFDLLEEESAISPRLGAAYTWSDDLVLRASYSRIVMQAPVENILVSSSSQARILTGADQGTVPTQVRAEKSHAFELGAAWRLNDYVSFDIAGYGKLLEDFIVKVELGNSGIIFPVNLKEGLVAGGEIRAELHNWNNISGFLGLSGGVAFGLKPEDGSSPIAAGLILGEEGRNYSHPFEREEVFPTEHNQLFTAVMNASYNHPTGLFATLGGRFDLGLPFDLTGASGEGLTPEQSRVELRRRGYSDEVIDLLSLEMEEPGSPDKAVAPHAVFDLAAGFNFLPMTGIRARVTLSALNVLDTEYLYKFESSFGGTHFGTHRTLLAKVEVGI